MLCRESLLTTLKQTVKKETTMKLNNLIEITPQRGDLPLEWLDKSPAWGIPKKGCYKVYNDGSHYVGSLRFYPSFEDKHYYDEYGLRRLDMCLFNTVKPCSKRKVEIKKPIDEYMDVIYPTAIQNGLKGQALSNHLYSELNGKFDVDDLNDYVDRQISRRWHNLHNRKKRFKRKAYLNKWNYFITVTYADGKHTEEQFKRKLRKCFSNLATRRGWRYMGVWENGFENDRLHFHALVYVPDGEMLGKVYEKEEYSTKKHEMVKTSPNTFFEKKFGRSDFKELNEMELKKGNTIEYLLKYIGKSNSKIVYSRGIKTSLLLELDDTCIACEMERIPLSYVLFDDVIDWERDVMRFRYEQQSLFERLVS